MSMNEIWVCGEVNGGRRVGVMKADDSSLDWRTTDLYFIAWESVDEHMLDRHRVHLRRLSMATFGTTICRRSIGLIWA